MTTASELQLELLKRENFEKCKARIIRSELHCYKHQTTITGYIVGEQQSSDRGVAYLTILRSPYVQGEDANYNVSFNGTNIELNKKDVIELVALAVDLAEKQIEERIRIKTKIDLAML